MSRGHQVRGHPCKLGNLAIFYHTLFSQVKRGWIESPPPIRVKKLPIKSKVNIVQINIGAAPSGSELIKQFSDKGKYSQDLMMFILFDLLNRRKNDFCTFGTIRLVKKF